MTDVNETYVLIFLEIQWTLSEKIGQFSSLQIDLVAIINNFWSKQISKLDFKIFKSRQKPYIKMKIILWHLKWVSASAAIFFSLQCLISITSF